MTILRFTVLGTPTGKGSVTAHHVRRRDGSLVIGHRGEPVIVKHDDSKPGERHAKTVEATALAARTQAGLSILRGVAVAVELRYFMPRPKSHYRTGRFADMLRDSAPMYPTTKHDLDKLVRHSLDALTGVVYADDSQVVSLTPEKVYCDPEESPRTEVAVSVLNEQTAELAVAVSQLALVA